LIKEVFVEDEVVGICQIPISAFNGRDQQIWRCTGNGEFSVRSTYHLENELTTNNKGECSYVRRQSNVWKRLWKMNVPNAVKVFDV
jgi:hypothetical protein